MSELKTKFQQLLQELFQFDLADLDFGIYRIMNYKRQVIERWITQDLPRAIEQELQQGALAEQSEAQKALEEAHRKVLETLGAAAIDAEGNLAATYCDTPLGKAYLQAREKAAHAQSSETLEAAVYNHLYAFFSRYYQDGDFISKRRYSKKERYAIPYNGEEVTLYWANHDQYYVKTAEHFTDYAWKAPNGVTVHFKLQAADVEQNNVKGEKRFFLPVLDEIAWETASPLPQGEGPGVRGALTIPFEYRPLTQQEEIAYGSRNQQEAIIADTMKRFTQRHKDARDLTFVSACLGVKKQDAQGNPVSYLEHHLRQYAARNTRDFFIHKDLRGFLSRELDFYLKNEVLNLEELEAAGETLAAGWFQLMRLIKRVGNAIIDFLAQIEDFQKALWEKKKFVTETFYVVTVGNIPEAFYADIAACDAQWQEWQALGMAPEGLTQRHKDTEDNLGVSVPLCEKDEKMLTQRHKDTEDNLGVSVSLCEARLAFLTSHPGLPLDTRHFPRAFTDRLLATFENLDAATDGLLVHSENWQALNLLGEKYRERVKCIYIDPPYNTGDSEILYKNEYLCSSWLSLMENRLALSMQLLSDDPVLFIAIDDFEMADLCELVDKHFPNIRREMLVVNHHPQGGKAKTLANTHEYMLACVSRSSDRTLIGRISEDGVELRPFKRSGTAESNFRYGRPNSFYAILVDPETKEIVGLEPPPERGAGYPTGKTKEGYIRVYPLGSQGEERVWRRSYESCLFLVQEGNLQCNDNLTIYQRIPAEERTPALFSNWIGSRYNAGIFGANLLSEIMGIHNPFSYPKSIYTVEDAIFSAGIDDYAICIDYFAGSGTTGHAVINLNREDGGRRKFILVEMADYFDSVLLPRIKKVAFSPEWKDGKPKRPATQEEFARGPRLVKVIRLESYEDALNNIAFDETGGQSALDLFGDEYLLRYMLRWESRQSATFLDVEKLQTPFSYTLRIHRDGETRVQPVDLPETFAYLLGLDVEARRVLTQSHKDTEDNLGVSVSPCEKDKTMLTQSHKDTENNLGVSVSPCETQYLLYRGTLRNGRKAAVLWRATQGWTQADYERDAAFVAEHQLTEGADDIFVNGDSCIPGAQSLDGLLKARLFG
ncbi:MAG: site-specific DNA-methyltransferase [Anaerolineae bacterium]